MAEFNVSLNELVNKANQLNELNQTFKGQVNTMTDIENGLNGMWEGEARNTFHNAFVQDANQMIEFCKAVTIYVETLINTADKYQEAELRNVEIGKTRSY